MKKYKLIKTYPGMKYDPSNLIFSTDPDRANYPEFWEEVKVNFKVGDWITRLDEYDNKFLAKIVKIEDNKRICTGFNYRGEWFESEDAGPYHDGRDRLATKEEIEYHLVQEAKRRYAGKTIKCLHNVFNAPLDKIDQWEYTLREDCLRYYPKPGGRGCAYVGGKWAEIVKEEPIMIAGYKAEYDKDHQVHFGCKTYSQESVNQLVSVMYMFDIVRFDTNKAHNVEYAVVRKVQDNFK